MALGLASLVAPLVETAIFQWVPIRKLGLRWYWGVLLSASMFGVSHWYSLSYMLAAFLVGLVSRTASRSETRRPAGRSS